MNSKQICMSKKINCLDLKQQHHNLKKEIFQAFEKVYDSTAFSGGVFVSEFEKNFANFVGANYAIGLSNGTVALHLAMLALDIGPGDEVIVPANTFIATAWGVSHAGARPVFVDCDSETWQIDLSKVEAAITSKTKAIIGVHLYGQPFDIDRLMDICMRYKIHLVEDAAQAHGAQYKGKTVGTFGELSCYSFYPGKNLGACGEAGGIVTNNKNYYDRLISLRNHGSKQRYFHDEIGYNYRMGGLEASSLTIKLNYLDFWNTRRREIANIYIEKITNKKIKFQYQPVWAKSVYHLFVVTVEDRERFVKHLEGHNINAAYHYPVPCHLQAAYADLNYKVGDMPNSEYLAKHCVSLPMYPELSYQELVIVIDAINKY